MKLLTLSLILILAGSGLVLSESTLGANESESTVSIKSSSLKHPNTPDQQSKPKSEQRGTKQSPLPIKEANPSQNTQDEPHQTTQESDSKLALYATWFQGGVLVLTLIVMSITAIRQLRAYMHLEGHKPILTDTADGMDVRLVLKNVGKTPAFKVKHWMRADILPFPLSGERRPEPFMDRNIYLPPSADLHIINNWRCPWRRANITMLDDNRRLYIWGEVRYRDAFYWPRSVKFCFTYVSPTESDLIYYEEGNKVN